VTGGQKIWLIIKTDSWPCSWQGSRAVDCSRCRSVRNRLLHVRHPGRANTYCPHCPGWVWEWIENIFGSLILNVYLHQHFVYNLAEDIAVLKGFLRDFAYASQQADSSICSIQS